MNTLFTQHLKYQFNWYRIMLFTFLFFLTGIYSFNVKGQTPVLIRVDDAPTRYISTGGEDWFKFQTSEEGDYTIRVLKYPIEISLYEDNMTTLVIPQVVDPNTEYFQRTDLNTSLNANHWYYIKIISKDLYQLWYDLNVISGSFISLNPQDPPKNATIDTIGETDWFTFHQGLNEVDNYPTNCIIQTYGSTDTYMYLYEEVFAYGEWLIAENDNGGTDHNAMIITDHLPYRDTQYYVRIKGADSTINGPYSIDFKYCLGNSEVYNLTSTSTNRQTTPVYISHAGEISINSISIYHNGGTGNVLLGVYSDLSGSPSSLLGLTPSTIINSTVGWQTVSLASPVTLPAGDNKVWLSFVFENNPGVRYEAATPIRAGAQSSETWSAGMPSSFGTSTITDNKFSLFCSFYRSYGIPALTVSPQDISLGSASGSTGTFDITSNTRWNITDDESWLNVSSESGINNGIITVLASSANTGTSPRTATVTINGTGVTSKLVTITQDYLSKSLGNTNVYNGTTTAANRRAMPVTFTEAGEIDSISIYHNGGTGNVLLGVYTDLSGLPASQLGLTVSTAVKTTVGWQTVPLTKPVSVTSGQTVWLAWVFQNSTGVRYMAGTPGRAQSSTTWSSGMPATFGAATVAGNKFSIYCKYTPDNVIVLPDVINPTITAFTIPAAYSSSSLTVPVSSFTAIDNVAVTGFKLTETATAPNATDAGWSTVAPTLYTFDTEGTKTLYAWAKDAAGNVSNSVSRNVTVTLPDMSPSFSEYLFNESAGSSVIDSKGPNNGTIINNAVRINGVRGGGLELTGSGNINLGHCFGENVENEVTLSAWIKPNATTGNYQGIIMHGGPNIDSYALYIRPDSKGIGFKTSGTSNAFVGVDNVNNLWDGNWHHLAVTYNGSQKVIYLDGVAIITMDATGKIESGYGYNLLIGAGRDIEPATLLYEGLIDEARIYNYALSGAQIGDLYDLINPKPDIVPPTITSFIIPATSSSLSVPVSNFTATDNIAVNGFKLTDIATAPTATDAGWSTTAPTSYTFASVGTKTLYAWTKDAAGNVSTSLSDQVVITLSKSLGNMQVYSGTTTAANRRAMPVTFTEAGEIDSISIYHNGGTGNVLLGVYTDLSGLPSSQLGLTVSTAVKTTVGWQTVPLTKPVSVTSGQTVWLAWVFQNSTGVRYMAGTPGRAQSSTTWSSGMPATFGAATVAGNKFSIYCKYTPDNVIVLPDVINPTITAFTIPAAYSSSSLTVPVSSFTAIDNVAVTGFKLTETATAPNATDAGWSTVAPTLYTFDTEGTKTLYAWAKDAAGNVSNSVSRNVTVTLPDMSPSFSEYLFNESAGSSVIDSKGPNNGTIINNAVRINGVRGGGLELTGSGNINLGHCFGENVENEVTLSAWIKPNATTGNYQGIIMHGGPNIDSYALYIRPDSKGIGFKTSGTSNAFVGVDNVNNLWDGNWHHLAVTYNGSQKVIYLDGVAIITMDATGKIESGYGYNLLIGAGRDIEPATLLYEGLIDEARIYNYALSGAQIGDLYDLINPKPDIVPPTITSFIIPATSSSLSVPVSNFTATDNIAVNGFKLTDIATAPTATDAGWSTTAPTSYTFASVGTKTLYAWTKDAAGNVSTSLSDQVVITLSKSLGNTNVYNGTTTAANRRAMPVTFTEAGEIDSISIYHNGGTGNVLLGVYTDLSGLPSSQLGLTVSTAVKTTVGWQTVPLTKPVSVTSGQTVWLAWVFQNSTGVRYMAGTPGRAQSSTTWSSGMPATFGAATVAGNKFSIYCKYTPGTTPVLTVSPTIISLDYSSGSSGTFGITSNTNWNITDDASWLNVSQEAGTNNEIITVMANSANTGTSARTATIAIAGTGVTSKTVTVTQAYEPIIATVGYSEVYNGITTATNRRAMPVTFSEAGTIQSISIYHNGGTGNVLLGVYSDRTGFPSTQLGVTVSTINATAGWQTVLLTNPVMVTSGQKVWLAWVFQNSIGVRYKAGTPGRAQSTATWTGGMPAAFGTSTIGTNKFSIYCTYTTSTKSAEIATAIAPDLEYSDLKVYPNPFNDKVNFEFVLADDAYAVLEIYNILGQSIATLLDQRVEGGVLNRIEYAPNQIISGIYIYKLTLDGKKSIGKLIYNKP